MRITITFLLINLLATGIPATFFSGTTPGEQPVKLSADRHIILESSIDFEEEMEILTVADNLKEIFPQDDQLVLLKIFNSRNEVIAKWQNKSRKVKKESIFFLKKATAGVYRIDKIITDGTRRQLLFRK